MVKVFLNKIKDSNHELAIAIKKIMKPEWNPKKFLNYLKFPNRELTIGYIMVYYIKEKEGQNSQEMRS